VLKNGGYELEHMYVRNTNAMSNVTSLLLIAFMIRQLIEKTFDTVKLFGSRQLFGVRLLESLRCDPYQDDESSHPAISCRFCFNTS
jgi:hypothetical protein